MSYISEKFRLSEYSDGQTPYIKDEYWWIGNTNTGVKAKGLDGVSFSGVVEYYTATLANNNEAPEFNPSTISGIWKQKIEDTGFGTKDANGVDYKYLWNVEGIKSIDQNGNETTDYLKDAQGNIIVDLYMTYTGGRVPKNYISYYATNTTNSAPDKQPTLAADGNSFTTLASGSKWQESSSYKGSADADIYLFEISFVEYAEKDENGQNLYAKISGPTLIGHNGKNGAGIKQINTYVRDFYYAQIPEGETNYSWTIPKPGSNTAFVEIGHTETWSANIDEGYDNNHIKIGDTAYLYGTVKDKLAADGQKQTITLYGTVTAVDLNSGVTMTTTNVIWGGSQGTQGPQGLAAQDFNVTTNTYMLEGDEKGNIKSNSVATLTAHGMNIDIIDKVKWYKGQNLITEGVGADSTTLTVGQTGVYTAKVDKWQDSVTIGVTKDGASGADAISISLTNPTMTFNKNTAGEEETCRVLVYEGNKPLTPDDKASSLDNLENGRYYVSFRNTNFGGSITVPDKDEDGSVTVNIYIKTLEGIGLIEEATVYWTVVNNGTSPYSIQLSNDSATIGTNAEGGYDNTVLQEVSTVDVIVYEGNTNITSSCSFDWEVSDGGTLNSAAGASNYFTTLNADTATATVTVKKDSTSLGSKQFTISKNKQGGRGDDAVTYVLSVSPNSWNKNQSNSVVPVFTVTKYVGNSSSVAPMNEYQIRKAGTTTSWATNTPIYEATTFELYIKDANEQFTIKADSETVDMVENGQNSTVPGPTGPTTTSNVIYAYLHTNDQSISTPNGTAPTKDPWQTNDTDASYNPSTTTGNQYVFRAQVTETIITENGIQTSITYKWSAPTLYKAWNNVGQSQTSYADYLRLTSFGTATNYYYDSNGNLIIAANTLSVSNKFYVSQNADLVRIGGTGNNQGWVVNANKMVNGILGKENSFHMYSGGDSSLSPEGFFGYNEDVPGSSKKDWRLTIGKNFGVNVGGILYCRGADITGTIVATAGEIGGCTINNGTLYITDANISGKLTVNSIDVDGVISAGSTNIQRIIANEIDAEYIQSLNITTNKLTVTKGATIGGLTVTEEGLAYGNINNGGLSIGSSGLTIGLGLSGTSQTFSVNTNSDTIMLGPIKVYQDYISGVQELLATYIGKENNRIQIGYFQNIYSSVLIDAKKINTVTLGDSTDPVKNGYFNTIHLINTDPQIQSNKWITIESTQQISINSDIQLLLGKASGSINTNYLRGSWQSDDPIADISDLHQKHDIEALLQNYNLFFNNLKPVRYKYNHGRSDRFHVGFIAQQVKEAIDNAQLNTKDYACICIENQGTKNELWTLRYGEFIALNTWQIQLLKPRMTAAEEKITALETEISQLKSELENLKNAQNSDII